MIILKDRMKKFKKFWYITALFFSMIFICCLFVIHLQNLRILLLSQLFLCSLFFFFVLSFSCFMKKKSRLFAKYLVQCLNLLIFDLSYWTVKFLNFILYSLYVSKKSALLMIFNLSSFSSYSVLNWNIKDSSVNYLVPICRFLI